MGVVAIGAILGDIAHGENVKLLVARSSLYTRQSTETKQLGWTRTVQ